MAIQNWFSTRIYGKIRMNTRRYKLRLTKNWTEMFERVILERLQLSPGQVLHVQMPLLQLSLSKDGLTKMSKCWGTGLQNLGLRVGGLIFKRSKLHLKSWNLSDFLPWVKIQHGAETAKLLLEFARNWKSNGWVKQWLPLQILAWEGDMPSPPLAGGEGGGDERDSWHNQKGTITRA